MDLKGPVERKMGARDRRRLAEATTTGPLAVLLRLTSAASPPQERELREAGLDIQYQVGPTITAVLPDPSKIEAIAGLPFVEQIEVSSTLYPESSDH
jgi:hypothetical protein